MMSLRPAAGLTDHRPPDRPSIYGDGRSGRSFRERSVVSRFVLNPPTECPNGRSRQVAGRWWEVDDVSKRNRKARREIRLGVDYTEDKSVWRISAACPDEMTAVYLMCVWPTP
jgi:hypothetical protein